MQRKPTPIPAAIRAAASGAIRAAAFAAPLLFAALDTPLADDMAPVAGETAAAGPAQPGRYTMVPVPGGFVRLDTETGLVAHCRRDVAAGDTDWQCITLSEPSESRDAALAARIDALAASVDALKRRVAGLEASVAGSKATPLDRVRQAGGEALRRMQLLIAEWKGVPVDPGAPLPAGAVNP